MFTKLLEHVFHHDFSVETVSLLKNEKYTSETLFIQTIKERQIVCVLIYLLKYL